MDLALLISSLSRQDGTTRHSQQEALYRSLRNLLLDGHIPSGTRLVSTRVLAAELGIARNSAVYAYERLAEEGFVAATRNGTITLWDGCGRSSAGLDSGPAPVQLSERVHGLENADPEPERMLPFVPGLPSLDEFPVTPWRRCIERAWKVIKPAQLAYGPVEGLPELRRAVAAYIRVSRGVRCDTGQVFITDGTQSSLELCARMLANPGEFGWLENPCYNGARTAFRSTGLELVPIEVDHEGMAPTDEQWRTRPPRLIYTTPSHQYPLGALMSPRRRTALVEHARTCGAWIIEDDYDSEFRHGGQPLPAIQGLHADAPVCYLGTFSKTMFPALRLGFMVVPPVLVERFTRTLRELVHRGHSADQLAMAEFIDTGLFARHLRKMRMLYAERRSSLEAALARHLGTALSVRESPGGMHLSADLAMPLHDTDVARAAAAHGLLLQPLSSYRVGDGRPYNGFVLGYAGLNDATIETATTQLAAVIEQFGRTRC
ncbi:TPA: PLP-dependent aminotransferase family protein [Burkholderia aenigmatica]|uniref:MocR-like pyridoxine biosynthesis transcription factor PdxR n=1 Tax=Burkholderia sp. AU45251 TaxID=3059204 RepID=UPI00264ECC66|nr:PLP-dependent aminotransferase family protein [Burkholderia sp. AU45251]HDR9485074.1 PLP-dependent aminotransferase family protein [Burkholderia aenigmatica]MDN7517628.1 PLP-dependent aminotransferase family protein [Burkholderia sp. AU45251]HDR9516621.1 PLP-dependent aminotransferase family protein [Burkholderia aenigmatica]HDR9593681.1 PLP-dependent aminotransferase family protein [Burkholderia aenigmatica]HDR9600281.1 PLP-dependent aminotransferase family protein [Burkholderia aenigmatic